VAQAQTQTRSPVRLRNLTVARADKNSTPASSNQANPDWIEYSQLPPLPDTQEEIFSIADALKADMKKDVFLKKQQASKHRVLNADLTNRRVIAFAIHRLLPGDLPGLTARVLVSGIFDRYGSNASLTRAEALRQSILALLDSPGYVDPISNKIVFVQPPDLLGAVSAGSGWWGR
jgi:CHAT domain-containing protein